MNDSPFADNPYPDDIDALQDHPLIRRPPIVLIPVKTVGCYTRDEQGRPWTTFGIENGSVFCVLCGAEITRGWVRGRLGEEVHVCSGHVEAQERPVDGALLEQEL